MPTAPQLAVRIPLQAVEAVEGGEVTFSLELTVASAGQWFLDGEALKASRTCQMLSSGLRHVLTLQEVPASLHGSQLKFVADGVESSIYLEVRGRQGIQTCHLGRGH